MSKATRRNRTLGLGLVTVVVLMVGLTYASAPLYRIFCQVTGFGGTTQVAETAPVQVLDRTMTVRFNADVNNDMPWNFQPVQRQVTVKVGQETLIHYRATNETSETITGSATFNVSPDRAGLYFSKIQCFCFTEQTLKPGESVDMPVLFFVDPALAGDRKMDDVRTITLSYTFFRAVDDSTRNKPQTAAAPAARTGG